jgi:hypothetical protein
MGRGPRQLPPGPIGGPDPARDFSFAAPGTTGGAQQTWPGVQPPPSLWDKLLAAAGDLGSGPQPTMPGTTVGAPAGQTAPPPPPSMLSQMQGQKPAGMGAYFQALQNPGATGGGTNQGGMIQQYLALQQLMRGA